MFFFVSRPYATPMRRLLMANGASLVLVAAIEYRLFEDIDPLFLVYGCVLPQAFCLVVGWLRIRGRATASFPHDSSGAEQSAPVRPAGNVMARFWRGELSLGVSFWVFGILGSIISWLLVSIFLSSMAIGAGMNPVPIFISISTVWLLSFAFCVWQTVGIWRSSDRHAESRVREGKGAIWAWMARVTFALLLIRAATGLGFVGLPQVTEAARIAFMNDPDVPAYSLRVAPNGTEVEIAGGIKHGLAREFHEVLKASPGIRVVHLQIPGGRFREAERLARLIRENGLVTSVSSFCRSACTIVFAAGRERVITESAELGFHTPPGLNEGETAASIEAQLEAYSKAGFAQEFITRAMAMPTTENWIPSVEELSNAGVITAIADGDDVPLSAAERKVERERLFTKLGEFLRILEPIRTLYPGEYEKIAALLSNVDGVRRTEADILRHAFDALRPLTARFRQHAADAILVDYGKLSAEQFSALARKNPTLCYEYIFGTDDDQRFSAELPVGLLRREVDLAYLILATAAPRPVVPDDQVSELWEKVALTIGDRINPEDGDLIAPDGPVDPSRHRALCDLWITIFRGIVDAPESEAAIMLRALDPRVR